jgi:hypothetical protein
MVFLLESVASGRARGTPAPTTTASALYVADSTPYAQALRGLGNFFITL